MYMRKLLKKFLLFLGSSCIISSVTNVTSCSIRNDKQPESICIKYDNSFDSPTIVGYIGVDETIDDKLFSTVASPSGAPNDATFTIEDGTDSRIKIGGTNNNQLVWGNFAQPTDITFKVIATSNIIPTVFGEIEVTLSIQQRPNPTSIKLGYSGESTNLVATIKDTTKSIGKISSQVIPSYARPEVRYEIRNNDSSVDISLDSDGYITWPQFQTPTNQDIHFDVVGTAIYGDATNSISFTLKAIYAQTASVELSYSSENKNLRGYIGESGNTGTDKLSTVVKPNNADQSVTYEVNIAEEYKDSVQIGSGGQIEWSRINNTINSIPFSVVAKSTADSSKISDPINFDLEITRRNPTSLRVNYSESTNLVTTILNQTKSTGTLSVGVEPALAFDDCEWIINDPNNLGIQIDENNYITWNAFNEPTDQSKSFSIQARATHGEALSNVVNFTIKAVYQPLAVNILWKNSSSLIPVASGINGQSSTISDLSAIVNPKPGTDQDVIWSIDNTRYFSINESGIITVKNTFPENTTMRSTITATSKIDSTVFATTEFEFTSIPNNVYPYEDMEINSNGKLVSIDIDKASEYTEFVFPTEVTESDQSIAQALNNVSNAPTKVSFAKGSKFTNTYRFLWYGCLEIDFSNCEDLEILDEFNYRGDPKDPNVKLQKIILPVNIKYFRGVTIKTCQDLYMIVWDGAGKNTPCQLNLSPSEDEPHIDPTGFEFTSTRWINSTDSAKGRFVIQNTTSGYQSSSLMEQFVNCIYTDCHYTFTNSHWSAV